MQVQKEHKVYLQTRNGYQCCSYCGSLTQEEFLKLAEAGAELEPTDKNYKVYVDAPNHDVGKPRIISSCNFDPKDDSYIQVTAEHQAQFHNDRLRLNEWIQIVPDYPTAHLKFYFQHLDEAGARKFVDLLNAKKLNIGYPGHFYVRPYFCVPASSSPRE